MRLKQLLTTLTFSALAFVAAATPIKVTMNAVSTTMSLTPKGSETPVEVGAAANKVYQFDAPAGEYVLTAYATDGKTVNGTIVLNITDSAETQEFTILTNTAYVSNKNADNSTWTIENGDYTIDLTVNTREGVRQTVTLGKSTTAGRYTFLAFNGNSYNVAFEPSEAHQAEGYTTLYKGGTLTFNVNVYGKIPMAADFTVTLPAEAELMIGLKFFHFINFTPVEPKSVETKGATKTVTYRLADAQVYNYRTWMNGGLTQAGYFTMSVDQTKCPVLNFTEEDFKAFAPEKINHDVKSNQGYETGDIFVNINPEGYLKLNIGDTFDAHAMRTWELTDNSTNNYFMEPDFHYTVIGLDGKPSTGVIEIENASTTISPWSQIKAVGKGTAIVLVTYDAIGLNYYSGVKKTAYLGGEYWGAIWPENTGAYIVTVGETDSSVVPNMVINEAYNTGTQKLAGKYVDAEHDVFYYLDTEEGATYTFTPENAAEVTIAYPTIGERTVTYSGFSTTGVTKNEDGSYTLLLKHGRQILKLTDAAGNAAYQVLTAKKCHLEISNSSRPGSQIFQPGDGIKIQYSGLFHPANKLAGIYNMSAYVTYNGVPNGTSLILGSGQYTFGSAASAQAVTVTIPTDHDVTAEPEIVMSDGVIQVNGYGDPIGNHRTISPIAGRSPNFTAIAHKTYFGAIPDIRIPLTAYKSFDIKFVCDVTDASISVTFDGKELTPNEKGIYTGTYGNYAVTASKEGYRCYRNTFVIEDNAEGLQTFHIEMEKSATCWDGKTLTEPSTEEGVYLISNGAELAWLADHVNKGTAASNARVINDIDLGNYDWTPIGSSSSKSYGGTFDGAGFKIDGLYINKPTVTYQGLFGYVNKGTVSGVTVYGVVSAKQYVGGIAAYINQNATIDRCANYANVSGTGTYVGGITGGLGASTAKLSNCYNAGNISGTTNCGGVAGYNNATAVIENIFNIGEVSGATVGSCIGGTTAKTNVKNAFSMVEYNITVGQILVSEEQMRSGEIAYLLGTAFGQTLGKDIYPILNGDKVFKVEYIVIGHETGENSSTIEESEILYSNRILPNELNGEKVYWFADPEMTRPVSSIESDVKLYAKIGKTSGIENISLDKDNTGVHWFNLQGIEVSAPNSGTHGIFIRVANGFSSKVIL